MAIQHLEQKRLVFAKKQTNTSTRNKKKEDEKIKKKSSNYDSMVKKVPAFILNNGFLCTMAFLNEKDEEVFYDIWNWHCESENNQNKLLSGISKDDFLTKLFSASDEMVRALTMETLSLMKCMRRFVKDDE